MDLDPVRLITRLRFYKIAALHGGGRVGVVSRLVILLTMTRFR